MVAGGGFQIGEESDTVSATEKNILAVVTPMNDMLGLTGKDETAGPRHGSGS